MSRPITYSVIHPVTRAFLKRTKAVSPLASLLLAGALGLALPLFVPRPAQAYPRPSVFPISWELKFRHALPKRISVKVPGQALEKAFWYMTFTVTNHSETEQQFLPVVELMANDGNLYRSDKNIPAGVFEAIKKRENNRLLEPLDKITGRILVGPDQARESVAIFPEPMLRMGGFSIFIGGLSGETVKVNDKGEVVNLTAVDADGRSGWTKFSPEERKKFLTLQKTLELDFLVPGDEFFPGEDKLIEKGEEWVMK